MLFAAHKPEDDVQAVLVVLIFVFGLFGLIRILLSLGSIDAADRGGPVRTKRNRSSKPTPIDADMARSLKKAPGFFRGQPKSPPPKKSSPDPEL